METEEIGGAPKPREVRGRAIIRVQKLDARGEAIGRVERWLCLPTADEWRLAFGAHADETSPADEFSVVGGLPGELIEIEVRWPTPRPGRRRLRHAPPRVRAVDVLETSDERVEARCPVFGECGGCQLQHMAYARQLAWKTQEVAARLRVAGVVDAPVRPALGCADPWN
jgi:hypothetical protein